MLDDHAADRFERDMEGAYVPRAAEPADVPRTVCACNAVNPREAIAAIQTGLFVKRLLDESHHIVTLVSCAACGQHWLRVFYERIDWSDGDDPQTWVYVPVTAVQAELLAGVKGEVTNAHLDALAMHGRYIVAHYPKGGGSSIHWGNGSPPRFPHD